MGSRRGWAAHRRAGQSAVLRGAMSQENVEIGKRGTEALLGGDLDGAFESVDPGIEWVETPGLGRTPARTEA